jgi:hypothetical protein
VADHDMLLMRQKGTASAEILAQPQDLAAIRVLAEPWGQKPV